ncbi:hypothetical protein CAPTEDRAFT_166556 [Capitella teleta]|uniref:Aquaporin n=1 Tax=Capitella teleta TaxID=283909 RepID=R7VJG6_CAPTE|nr:hypothetical protein CAPTEDRAFT_166556 [Capitella teleta]|eukprot:ELU16506.1 hypothetical protein CAPTEDRAFT_166556 [Capitella teleta]
MSAIDEETPSLGKSQARPEPKGMVRVFLKYLRPPIGEFHAVCLFVFVGVVASTNVDTLSVAVAHGLAIALLVAVYGGISGGHVNPAVTFGVVIGGRCEVFIGLLYIIFQLLGGVFGAALARMVLTVGYTSTGNVTNVDLYEAIGGGVPQLAEGVTAWNGVFVEAILTFILVLTVLMTAVDQQLSIAPLCIGFAVLVDIIVGGSITGAAMNPARSFGPALVAGIWTNEWIYWIGPILGALFAGGSYRVFLAKSEYRILFKDKSE